MANKKQNSIKSNNEGEKSPSKSNYIRKTKDEELNQWDALYMYVKYSIFEYDKHMNLPNYCIVRLKGMAQGKFWAEDREKTDLAYGYQILLETFKEKKVLIKYGLKVNRFNNESHRINWVFKIIENSINDVYIKETQDKKNKEKHEEEFSIIENNIKRRQSKPQEISENEKISNPKDPKCKPATDWDRKHQDMW